MAIRKKLKSLFGGLGKKEAGGANYLPQTASSPLSAPPPQPAPSVPAGPPSPGGDRSLTLYGRQSCGYCRRVDRRLEELPRVSAIVARRNTGSEADARNELASGSGRDTVPCLKIDDYWLFESDEIIKWLEDHDQALNS